MRLIASDKYRAVELFAIEFPHVNPCFKDILHSVKRRIITLKDHCQKDVYEIGNQEKQAKAYFK